MSSLISASATRDPRATWEVRCLLHASRAQRFEEAIAQRRARDDVQQPFDGRLSSRLGERRVFVTLFVRNDLQRVPRERIDGLDATLVDNRECGKLASVGHQHRLDDSVHRLHAGRRWFDESLPADIDTIHRTTNA